MWVWHGCDSPHYYKSDMTVMVDLRSQAVFDSHRLRFYSQNSTAPSWHVLE